MNKAILMGRLTRDPDIRYTQGNEPIAIARYTLAVDRRIKRENEQTADFIGCVAFAKQAEFAESKNANGSSSDFSRPEQTAGPAPDEFYTLPEGEEKDLPFS